MSKSKRYQNSLEKFDPEMYLTGREAIEVVKSFDRTKFDETIDLVVRLGVDPRKTEEMIRSTVALPAGTGKAVRVAVFAQGEDANAAREAGADHVGGDDLASEVEGGMLDFEVAISTPEMMATVGKLGKMLGPRGLMPNPKSGTVTEDVAKAVEDFKGGKVEFRTDRHGNVHLPIGKASFSVDDLTANLNVVVEELERLKPASAKGRYIKTISVSSTMSPGVRIDLSRVIE
ncbi:MAG: 50S ribosomal protein L1 [Actinobacteria bacterium]|nr:50S ribosomal protein L1 [Actinomycetota bacterium]|tara:strand:- start:805 stop:1497 length:693 start_codon:yes stop_codon:yes gene_type:complete